MIAKKMAGMIFFGILLVFGVGAAFGAPFLIGEEVQLLEDQDAEVLLNPDGTLKAIDANTTIAVGDLFAGVFKIQLTENVPSGDNTTSLQDVSDTFTAIFLLETLSSTGDGVVDFETTDKLEFGPADLSSWTTIFGAGGVLDISSEWDLTDLDGLGTGLSSGTMALLFDGVAFDDASLTLGTFSDSTTSFVADARLLYEWGFTEAGGIAAANEFWFTRGVDAEFPFFVGTNSLTNRLSLNITQRWAGPELLPHNHLGTTSPFDLNFTLAAQVQGKGSFDGTGLGPWPLVTDTDVYIKAQPIPEPSTIMLFGFGLLGFAWISRKKILF